MGTKSWRKASAIEVWGHRCCVRCLGHQRGKLMFPIFKFALELLLTCINSHLMQGYREQSEWPDIKGLALICNEQVGQFNAWWSLTSLLLKATRPVVCLQASHRRGWKKERGSASSSPREVRKMIGILWQYVWGLITLNANKSRSKNSPLSFFLSRQFAYATPKQTWSAETTTFLGTRDSRSICF